MECRGLFAVLVAALLILTGAVSAAAAPAGKVVIAQGVDPTTLDMMNQQEQPASNVGAQMFDMLVERDQSLKLVPSLASELPKLVNPTTWEIKLKNERLAQYHRINKLWIEEVPAVPLYQQIDLYGASKRVAWKARSDELIRAYDMALK